MERSESRQHENLSRCETFANRRKCWGTCECLRGSI